MRRIDELHRDYPFAGAPMLRDLLALAGVTVGRKHVATLMRRMGIEAIYRKPNTRRRHPKHPIYPYLLQHLKIDRPNQVWAMDITDIPMAKGFVYLAIRLRGMNFSPHDMRRSGARRAPSQSGHYRHGMLEWHLNSGTGPAVGGDRLT